MAAVENVISTSQVLFHRFFQSSGDIRVVVLGESVILPWSEDEKTSAYPARHCGIDDVHGIGIVISVTCSVTQTTERICW